MRHEGDVAGSLAARKGPLWIAAIGPLLLLAGLVALIVWMGPADALRGRSAPPVERLAFQRVELGAQGIVAMVFNDGPNPVAIAQVQVDEAYWAFSIVPAPVIAHLRTATLRIPYPWVEGETHVVRIVTSTGVTFDHEILVALETPTVSTRFVAMFALIGLYVGVIPVSIGLLWFPLVRRVGRRGVEFLLALTIGLLLFLLVDTTHEGVEVAGTIPASFQGVGLFVFGAFGAYLGLEALGGWLRDRRRRLHADAGAGYVLALLIAIGIGLHNFGEGLAIGAAFALGEVTLGALLIIGFTLHNTTEGLAIVAPLSRERTRIRDLIRLGLIGGAPTIAGAWLGGLVYSPFWSVLFLAIGAGAIAQVVLQISRQVAGEMPMSRALASVPVMAGLFAGFAVMYVTGMLVG